MGIYLEDEQWLSLVDAFSSAALNGGWLDALSALSTATGSRSGELIGLGSDNAVAFNWVTDLSPEYAEDFVSLDGGNPAVNPFVREGCQLRELQVLASQDFVSPEDTRKNPFLIHQAKYHDISHICLSNLLKNDAMLIGLAVMRSVKQGPISPRQRGLFTSIVPHVRAAVRTQITLEHQGAKLVAGSLEAMTLAGFVCDRYGLVKAMTPAAEQLVAARTLRVRRGVLGTGQVHENQEIKAAIGRAIGGLSYAGMPTASSVVVGKGMARPMVLEICPMPSQDFAFGFAPRAVVVVRGAPSDIDHMRRQMAQAYGLTAAETDVALRLLKGQTPDAIAQCREARIGTVRAQIRSIYEKFDVSRFSEFAAKFNQV